MKQIQAYIRAHKKDAVHDALYKREDISGMTIIEVEGWGRAKRHAEEHQAAEQVRDFTPYVKVELFCLSEIAEEITDSIRRAAHTGLEGDGKIYISPVEDAVRISTGEHGAHAC